MGNSRSATVGTSQSNDVVRAGGGLVVRQAGSRWHVALVHRPMREDWSFPKGKLEEDETLEDCALREVLEETSLICQLVRFLGHTEYEDRKGRSKVVAYWMMTVKHDDGFETNDEVDEVRWVDLAGATDLLSYERDRALLAIFAASDDLDTLLA